MKNKFILAAIVAPIALGNLSDRAYANEVLTFEDITNDTSRLGYHGFDLDYLYRANSTSYPGSGYDTGTFGDQSIFVYESFLSFTRNGGELFDLGSLYATGAWMNGITLTVEGLVQGVKTYSTQAIVGVAGPTLLSLNWSGIDQIIFRSSTGTYAGVGCCGNQVVLDNITIGLVPVPGPEAGAGLGALALGGLALYMKRRRKEDATAA